MKKALLVTLDYEPSVGGVSAYWKRVTASLGPARIVVLAPTSNGHRDASNVVRKPLLFRFVWPRWSRCLWHAWRTYRSESCGVIIAAQILPIGTVAYLLKLFFRIPYVVQVYGMDLALAKTSGRRAALVRRILQNAAHVISNSRATAGMLSSFGFHPEDSAIVYPIPDRPVADPELAKRLVRRYSLEGKKIILTVGRLVERKGHDMVIKAMPNILETVSNVVYVIAGDGPNRQYLEGLAKQVGISVLFLGKIGDAERNAWLSICDVFAMPARAIAGDIEGFGMVYLEAAAFGKPVVAGKSGGVAEAVRDGVTGLLVDPQSVQEVAAALAQILRDQDLTKRLGVAGSDAWKTQWDWSKEMQTFERCLS